MECRARGVVGDDRVIVGMRQASATKAPTGMELGDCGRERRGREKKGRCRGNLRGNVVDESS